jgi:hypothetical protein
MAHTHPDNYFSFSDGGSIIEPCLQFPLRLGYDTIAVLSQYWEGQGDPLYAILSRRGCSVDWVEVDASELEIIRLRDTCSLILANPESEESHRRVATSYLERANRCYTKVRGRAALHRSALFGDIDRLRNGGITDEEFGYIKLTARGEGGRQCGLNADWSVSAWHIGPSASPNQHDGDLYLLDDEDGYMSLVQRTYGAEMDGGNDLIDQICRWSSDELV